MSLTSLNLARSIQQHWPSADRRLYWVVGAALLAFVVYLSTVQTVVNSYDGAYGSDVGEIQNALPRWGTIHRSGYPLYTALGSAFVTVVMRMGFEPAVGVSLFSAVWGAFAIGLLVWLALELGVPGPAAALGGLISATVMSMWTFASIAELHTMTMALSIGSLVFAVRLDRTCSRADLLWLTFFFTQGAVHQRAVVLLAPAIFILAWPAVRVALQTWRPALAVACLAPLTYLYLPVRAWMGATWTFGQPGTWDGFWKLVFDNRAERVVHLSTSVHEWQSRLALMLIQLGTEMSWPLLLMGLTGLALVLWHRPRLAVGLTLAWLPYLALSALIWKSGPTDAQLATMLTVPLLAGVGVALVLGWLLTRSRPLGLVTLALVSLALVGSGWGTRQQVLAITRDTSVEAVTAQVEQLPSPSDGRQAVLVAPWGRDYWALSYAQAYQGKFPRLTLVDHNADFAAMLARGDHLLALSEAFYGLPLKWWKDKLGDVHLASAVPGVIELSTSPPVQAQAVQSDLDFDLKNGIHIREADVTWDSDDELRLTVYWRAVQDVNQDYHVAVHLLARTSPASPGDILAQADATNPVEGWYPTSEWEPGETVRDMYLIEAPEGSQPQAVRIALYQVDPKRGFVNSPWLVVPVH